MNWRKWAQLCAGGMAVAALLWGCFNPVSVPAPGGDSGTKNPDTLSPAAQGPEDQETGIAGEEFTVTLGIGGGSRSIVGPGAGGIRYGGIRNIVQVIVVNAGTGDVAHFQQEVRESDAEESAALTVKNLWPGQRYHILVLTGHRERDYGAETNPSVKYVYKTDPPTLLAAGLLADREIKSGETSLVIPMKPLAVDTVFTYGGGTAGSGIADAALGGTALPAGVEASIVWTLTGGIETLRDAQAGSPGGSAGGINLNWGDNPFKSQHTVCSLNDPQEAPAALTDHDRITLDLGKRAAGGPYSANFKLEYLPFGFGDMTAFTPFNLAAASWVIRNGVNDQAQNAGTVFPNPSAPNPNPWNTTANGNGAVAFSFVNQEISHIDLTGLFPAPVTGAMPVTGAVAVDGGTYTGTVEWKAVVGGTSKALSLFEGETVYMATVTLEPAAGFQFTGGVTVTHGGASGIKHVSKTGSKVEVEVLFPETGAFWEWGGYFSGSPAPGKGNMDSAIDIISLAQGEGWSSLSLKLLPWPETVKTGGGSDFPSGGLSLATFNSPAAVTIDGGGKTIELPPSGMFSPIAVGSGVTLTLQNITFKGSNNQPLITVNGGGTLVLEDGAVITGNKGNGVQLSGAASKLVMNGGTISNNARGVYLNGGVFTMNGGTISGNTNGGGVYVGGGTFTKNGGGIIYGGNETGKDADNKDLKNTAASGHAVYVSDGSKIRDDTAWEEDDLDSAKTGAEGGWE